MPEKGGGKENRAKTASFWPVPFKIKKGQNDVILDPQSKKKLGLNPNPLQPDGLKKKKKKKKKEKKEKEKEKKEGSEGVSGRRRVRRPRRALRAFVKGRRAAPSLGAPFTTMA